MILSYLAEEVRDYCNSLEENSQLSPFSKEERLLIRSLLSDLRAADNIKDAPLSYSFISTDSTQILIVSVDNIRIICELISKCKESDLHLVKRLKIIDIKKVDLQIIDTHKRFA